MLWDSHVCVCVCACPRRSTTAWPMGREGCVINYFPPFCQCCQVEKFHFSIHQTAACSTRMMIWKKNPVIWFHAPTCARVYACVPFSDELINNREGAAGGGSIRTLFHALIEKKQLLNDRASLSDTAVDPRGVARHFTTWVWQLLDLAEYWELFLLCCNRESGTHSRSVSVFVIPYSWRFLNSSS